MSVQLGEVAAHTLEAGLFPDTTEFIIGGKEYCVSTYLVVAIGAGNLERGLTVMQALLMNIRDDIEREVRLDDGRVIWPTGWLPPMFELSEDGTPVRFIGPLTKDDLR
jgi:hypothetical protein